MNPKRLLALALACAQLVGISGGVSASAGTPSAAPTTAAAPFVDFGAAPAVTGTATATATAGRALTAASSHWIWPLAGRRVVARHFLAPPDEYGPGHRGIDVRADSDSLTSLAVLAPANGAIAFAGPVAGRGVLTIDLGNSVVVSLEPVTATVEPGQAVASGDVIGWLSLGGHAPPGILHLGVRVGGIYVNPLLFLGGAERARLLPQG